MSFSFGFSGDDVGDDNDGVGQTDNAPAQAEAQSQFVGLPAEEHSIDDLVGLFVLIQFSKLSQNGSIRSRSPKLGLRLRFVHGVLEDLNIYTDSHFAQHPTK